MCRNKKKLLAVFLICGVIGLAGCNRRKVDYIDESDTRLVIDENGGLTAGVDEQEYSSSEKIAGTIGVENEKTWKQIINNGSEQININANLYIPDVTNMATFEVEEYYYTNEDKKKVLDYFFDKDSVTVNAEKLDTKENLEELIGHLEHLEECYKDDQEALSYIDTYKQSILAKIADAPYKNDIDSDVGDYSQPCYKGIINGIGYEACFCAKPEANLSYFRIQPEDYTMLNDYGKDSVEGCYVSTKNECTMTTEEAIDEACIILSDLDIKGMVPVSIQALAWYNYDDMMKSFDYERMLDGYEVIFTRDLMGVKYPNDLYYLEHEYKGLDNYPLYTEWGENYGPYGQNYDQEVIMIDINDKGLVRMYYGGILKQKDGVIVDKLLSVDKIKEILAGIIENEKRSNIMTDYNYLELSYIRVKSDKNEDIYCYVPVWKLGYTYLKNIFSGDNIELGEYVYFYEREYILINAIDGSRIKVQDEGLGSPYMAWNSGWFMAR